MSHAEPRRTSRSYRRGAVALLVLLVVTELFLRSYFGFCDTVLMRADPHYEYIAQPDQDRMRFRNHIVYNSLSMRSPEPDSSAIIILGCGDSVINGGVLTDQDSLATTALSTMLTEEYGRSVQFLNISAGSWGPDNCAAYLRHTDLPNGSALVLIVSSHDAHDNMSFKPVVGVRPSFPNEQYALALGELLHRYLLPRILPKPRSDDEELGIDKGGEGFNPGFAALQRIAEERGIPFVIVLHADLREIRTGAYDRQGEEIIAFAQANGIHLVRDLDHGMRADLLRDKIHPNDAGQRKLGELLFADIVSNPASYGLSAVRKEGGETRIRTMAR